jgi:predicted enzyme related to lactoylglutathione lyase
MTINPNGVFIWYELLTTDADASADFYSGVVGWQVAASGMPGMDYRLLMAGEAQVGGLMQLSQDMLDGGALPVWLGYISVDDADGAVARIAAAGGKVQVPPTDIPNVGRFAMVADPQGIPIYVLHDQGQTPSTAFAQGLDGHCAWNELETPDPKAALDFYGGQFGWKPGETMSMGEAGDYLMFELDGAPIGGMMQASPVGSSPMWRFYFRVPSLEAAMRRVRAGGGQVLHGPQPVPGDDEIALGMDPQGAAFALVSRAVLD